MPVIENPDGVVVVPEGCPTLSPLLFLDTRAAHLVILNQPIRVDLGRLWHCTQLHVCADGGANALYSHFETDAERLAFVPDYIVGDLDSLRLDVRDFYTRAGCVCIKQTLEYAHDLNKAVDLVVLFHYRGAHKGDRFDDMDEESLVVTSTAEYEQQGATANFTIVLAGGLGGRFDHAILAIAFMYTNHRRRPGCPLVLVNGDDVVFLVPEGKTFVELDRTVVGSTCGFLPLAGPCVLSTWGALYDVREWDTSVGLGVVSSSNLVLGPRGLVVECQGSSGVVMNVEWGERGLGKQ